MLKQIQIFFRIFPFSITVRKTYIPSISLLISDIVTFKSNKKGSLWISPKMLQNNRNAYFCSMWLTLWRKTFLLTFFRFYWFDQKQLLIQSQIFLSNSPFSNMVRKKNFQSISVIVSEVVTLCLKRTVLYQFLQKCFKTTERHSLAVCGLLCREK